MSDYDERYVHCPETLTQNWGFPLDLVKTTDPNHDHFKNFYSHNITDMGVMVNDYEKSITITCGKYTLNLKHCLSVLSLDNT